jgi:alanine racemase
MEAGASILFVTRTNGFATLNSMLIEHSTAATLTIDLGAIVKNWRLLGAQAGQLAPTTAACAAVVKADAYGLGLAAIGPTLYRAGCREFFVALVAEGIELRSLIPRDATVYVLHGPQPGAELDCAQRALIPVINSTDQLQRWSGLANSRGERLRAALQVDTGMRRLGFEARDFEALDGHSFASATPGGIQPVLLMSHLVSAEDPADPINRIQLEQFEIARKRWPGLRCSLANSSGIFLGPDWHFDLLRPGAALYGVAPVINQPNPMRPVIRLQVPIIQTRMIAPGEKVGYNHTWRANRQTRVATLSAGYADGFLRSLSNRATVRFMGQAAPLIGRVSMDTITVDVTELPEHAMTPGAQFDLIDSVQDINRVASEAGTNAYEILTSLGSRYRRQYLAA